MFGDEDYQPNQPIRQNSDIAGVFLLQNKNIEVMI